MTGTAPWPASDEAADLFQILKPLGDLERYQFQDCRNRAVRLGDDDFVSAVYSRPGEAYMLLANLQPKAREAICRIDPRELQNPMAAVRSAALIDKGQDNTCRSGNSGGKGRENSVAGGRGRFLLHLMG